MKIDWNTIPTDPGVYLWKDINGQVIYIGKAKNIKKRMKQYFRKDLSLKNKLLFKNIHDYDFQVCSSDLDALIQEQTLINEYEPKFNIKIKSSKIYPYIELKIIENGLKLSISKTMKFIKNAKYYGPYPDGYSARKIIKILLSVFPIDKCLSLNSKKPCLNREMGKCMGQCIGLNIENKKTFILNKIEEFFKGNFEYVEKKLTEKLEKYNKLLEFEESKKIFENILLLKKLKEQETYAFKDKKHRDIINYYVKDGIISISMMFIRFGKITLTTNFINKLFNPDPINEVESFLERIYARNNQPEELIVPFETNWKLSNMKATFPKKGIKYELLNLTLKNAKAKFENQIEGFLEKIKSYELAIKFLKLNTKNKEINTIEMVDISSLRGQEQVGAIVHFKNGEPNKSLYRKYIIKNVNKMNDYASIEEVVKRHFSNKKKNKLKMPDVFIVDGKNQLLNAKKILKKLNINNVILCALKKNSHHKTESLINNSMKEINIEKNSHMYHFLSRIQDEAHRFVISFHRSRRDKKILESYLDKYKFLNELDKQLLFKEFKSIRKIFIANESTLKKVIGEIKAKKILKDSKENG